MPRYLIRRNFGAVDDEAMTQVGINSNRVIAESTPDIVWEVSHVVASPEGDILTYCVYQAPNEERVREHAELLGGHFVEAIYEIGGDVAPADFPA
ncbi:MAG: nickel-binding protein [Acidimicrobiia bacterium]